MASFILFHLKSPLKAVKGLEEIKQFFKKILG